jgi:hypothetical protein
MEILNLKLLILSTTTMMRKKIKPNLLKTNNPIPRIDRRIDLNIVHKAVRRIVHPNIDPVNQPTNQQQIINPPSLNLDLRINISKHVHPLSHHHSKHIDQLDHNKW